MWVGGGGSSVHSLTYRAPRGSRADKQMVAWGECGRGKRLVLVFTV